MDHEAMFVRPVDLCAYQPDMGLKSPVHSPSNSAGSGDEKFIRYDSSPESMDSYLDENTFSPILDDDLSGCGKRALNTLRQHLFPYQDILDSFTTFPIALDRLDENLVLTYLTDYAESVYGFSPALRPHPIAAITSLSMTKPASLHLIIARSALFRQSFSHFQSKQESSGLELAAIKHRGEALQLIRNDSTVAYGQQTEDLIAPIIGLGMLDHYSGADTSCMHFGAVQQILRSIGGPLKIQSLWLSRCMVHFECTAGTKFSSYLWDRSDFPRLHTELNEFLANIWSTHRVTASRYDGRQMVFAPVERQRPIALKLGSTMHEGLLQRADTPTDPTQQERLELTFQLTCLLTLCTILADYPQDPRSMQDFIDSVHGLVEASQLQGRSSNNIMWLLQVHDHSDAHSKRVWDAAGWVWILRHVNYNVQCMVKDWLIAVLTGKPLIRALKLDSFAFSYAS